MQTEALQPDLLSEDGARTRSGAAVLFDLDGTLLDTPRVIAEELVHSVQQIIGSAPPLRAAASLVGQPLDRVCAQLAGADVDAVVTEQIVNAYRERYRTRIVPRAAQLLFPGVREGLAELSRHGLGLAVVTSKQRAGAELILQAAQVAHWFSVVVGVDDTDHPKPHPDPVRRALALLRADPASSVMVGDTEHDVRSGQQALVATVAVTYGVGQDSSLRALGPTAMAATFDDVVKNVLGHIRCKHSPELEVLK